MSVTFPPPLPKNTSFFNDKNSFPIINSLGHAPPKNGEDSKLRRNVEDGAGKDQRLPLPAYVLVDNLRSPDGHQSKLDGSSRKEARPRSKRSHKSSQKIKGHGDAEQDQARRETLERLEKIQTTSEEFRNFPPHDLFMHLSARVQEVVACAEAMWEWVLEEQERWREKQEQRARQYQNEFIHEDHRGDEEMRIIRRMTRNEFDAVLTRFEM